MMERIERAVNEANAKHKLGLQLMSIDGSTKAEQRNTNVNRFQEDANCRVAILNIKAAGVGYTLTAANYILFAELAWTPSEVQQAEDRAHRIGQTQCVQVQLLLVKDSIDEVMWELLQSKLATTGQVLDGQAERMEVDRSAAHSGRGRGGGGSGGNAAGAAGAAAAGAAGSAMPGAQPSILSYFGAAGHQQPAAAPGALGGKKQRTK